ncbi:hypothetical protein F4604DRAFT_1300179 [Suillus subluteus]|nr:hypothetical protein F4604DRAFT_1300179 [Suillus subluteus]
MLTLFILVWASALVCLPSVYTVLWTLSIEFECTCDAKGQAHLQTILFNAHLVQVTSRILSGPRRGYFNAPLPAIAKPSHNQPRNIPEQQRGARMKAQKALRGSSKPASIVEPSSRACACQTCSRLFSNCCGPMREEYFGMCIGTGIATKT